MRHFAAVTGLALVACAAPGKDLAPPPDLNVTSPMRSLVQSGAGNLTVTGTATAGDPSAPIQTVMVNQVAATVGTDGSFTASVQVEEGVTLIQTVATDSNGNTATDTRSVEAGAILPPGSNIPSALTAAVSANAFTNISALASSVIMQQDFGALLAPMQPMVSDGDPPNGCLFGQVFVNDVTFTNANISLVPVQGGLQFSAELDGLDVPSNVNFAVACIGGSDTAEVTADSVVVSGTLLVAPNGSAGFTATLQSPNVQLTNFQLNAGGIPGEVLDLIDLNDAISGIISTAAQVFMGPMINDALGSLAGQQQLTALGQTIDLTVAPSAVSFDPSGGLISLDTQFSIAAAQNTAGFVSIDVGMPDYDPGNGLQLGINANLINEAIAQITALGQLQLAMSINGGSFDSIQLAPTSAPMLGTDPTTGDLELFLPDMKLTFLSAGTPVGDASLNGEVTLAISSTAGGTAVQVQLGTPQVNVDVLDDIPNATYLSPDSLAAAVKLALGQQVATISSLLQVIPLPTIDGVTLRDLSVTGDSGYLLVGATIQ